MSETVTVACKHQTGLILRLHEQHKESHPLLGGGLKEVDVYRPIPDAVVKINGPSLPKDANADRPAITAGYALTHGVPKDFWDAWCEQNKDSDLLKNRIIFAHVRTDAVNGMAKEGKAVRSGLEPIDPTTDEKGRSNDPRARSLRVSTLSAKN